MTADYAAQRTNMVESQVRTADVTDLAVQDAMRAAPREALVPAGKGFLAYADAEIEYAPGRWMLKPRDIAKLLQAVGPTPGDRALAISAPYAAQVLALIGLRITAIDAAEDPPPGALFDVIVCEGAVASAPDAWRAALAPGGRLGVVERDGPVGRAMLWLRGAETVGRIALFDSTPPVLAGFDPVRTFAL
jgi:protein-L-isoaspartate(D-aspartate) O-methyltransferase